MTEVLDLYLKMFNVQKYLHVLVFICRVTRDVRGNLENLVAKGVPDRKVHG